MELQLRDRAPWKRAEANDYSSCVARSSKISEANLDDSESNGTDDSDQILHSWGN
jgi:hypothetical protein